MNDFNAIYPNSTSQRLERSVVMSIVNDLKFTLELEKDIKVFIKSKLDEKIDRYDNDDSHSTPRHRKVTIEYTTSYEHDMRIVSHDSVTNNKTVLEDKQTKFSLTPLLSSVEFNLQFKFSTRNNSEILDLKNKILRNNDIGREDNIHSLSIRYPLPKYVNNLASQILKIINEVDGTSVTLEEYLDSIRLVDMAVALDVNGNPESASYLVEDNQLGVIGRFENIDIDEKPELQFDDNMYEYTFNYIFTVELPTYVNMKWEALIYNKLLPKEYLQFEVNNVDMKNAVSRNKSIVVENFYTDSRKNEDIKYLTVPRFDSNNKLMMPNPYYVRLLTVMVTNKPANSTLFNLKEIPGIIFKPEVISYLENEYQDLNKPYKGLFQIELHKHDLLQDFDKITIDSNLNVITNIDLDVKDIHRLSFNVLTSFKLLTKDKFYIKKQYKEVIESLRVFFDTDVLYTEPLKKTKFEVDNFKLNDKGLKGCYFEGILE